MITMWNFVKQFIRDPMQTGAIVSSSKELAQAMVEPINFQLARHIVELGPGTGVFTRLLLSNMSTGAQLVVIELNEDFCRELEKIDDPRLSVIQGNALELSAYVEQTDYVVSGLPLNVFSKQEHRAVLAEIKRVVAHAYIQFHYSPLAERYLRREFPHITKKFVAKNIPPAIVYTARA